MAGEKKPLARSTQDPLWALARIDQENPTQADLETLRQALREDPGLWKAVGDLADQAASAMALEVQATPVGRELVKANYAGLKRDLGFEAAAALERILIAQVALTWLRLNILEQGYTQNTMARGGSFSTETANYWERRLSAAQRRHLRACETLARVRKMGIAALQVNIAQQQVNIAGGP